MKNISGIYKITNLTNGKVYIGSAVNIEGRWSAHKSLLEGGKHHSRYFQNAWNKYGDQSFQFEILEKVENKEDLIAREQHYLDFYQSYEQSKGYNICLIAGSSLGVRFSNEVKKKLSDIQKEIGHKGENNEFYGKIHSEESKKKMSENHWDCGGENNVNAKLTWEIVGEIRKIYYEKNISKKQLAREYNVTDRVIRLVIENKTWKDESYVYAEKKFVQGGENVSWAKLTWDKVREIRKKYLEGGTSYKKLAIEYSVSKATIQAVVQNINWYDENYNFETI
jgi:group I intron endonuclease